LSQKKEEERKMNKRGPSPFSLSHTDARPGGMEIPAPTPPHTAREKEKRVWRLAGDGASAAVRS